MYIYIYIYIYKYHEYTYFQLKVLQFLIKQVLGSKCSIDLYLKKLMLVLRCSWNVLLARAGLEALKFCVQWTLSISTTLYLEHHSISNYFPGPLNISTEYTLFFSL